MIAKTTLQYVQQFCKPAIEAGIIPADQFRELVTMARKNAESGTPEKTPHLIRTREAAGLLGCCAKTILRLADRGALPKVYLEPGNHKTLRFRSADVAALIEGDRQ